MPMILTHRVLSVLPDSVDPMVRLTHGALARMTLQRQFPRIPDRGPDAVLDLVGALGPIQSQVPRSPFLTASSRLPGVTYATVNTLLTDHLLLKTTNVRGTVHTSTRAAFAALDAVARPQRSGPMRNQLGLTHLTPADVVAEVESFCSDGWRTRTEIITHARAWLAEHESAHAAVALTGTYLESMTWGHSGLLRRPRDGAWEKRTDLYHRRARSVVQDLGETTIEDGLSSLVRTQLGACGPLTREDLAYFFGTGLGAADRAVSTLGDEVVRLVGPDDEKLLDLAEPPTGGDVDPGLRLTPEFDALLVGFHRSHRTRFLTAAQMPEIWAEANGQFRPAVLHDGRIVAFWKTLTKGSRTDIEVTMLTPYAPLPDDLFADQITAVESVLGLTVTDLRVRGRRSGLVRRRDDAAHGLEII